MSKGSSKPAYQTVTQTTSLPAWIDQGGQDNYNLATQLASQPFQQYGGQRIAAPSADLSGAWQGVRDLQGDGVAAMQPGMNMAQAAGSFTPSQVTAGTNGSQIMPGLSPFISGLAGGAPNINAGQVNAGSFLSGNIGAYMSPYTSNVESYAMQALDDQRKRSLNQTADQAISAGAFGGSRHGVMEGVVNAEAAKSAGALSAQLRDQAFNTGANLMTQDMNRGLQAGMANQTAGLQAQLGAAQLGLQGMQSAGQLALSGLGQDSQIAENNLTRAMQAQGLNQQAGLTAAQNATNASKVLLQGGQTGQQLTSQELAMLEAAGKSQTAYTQSGLDLAYNNFQEQQAYPMDMLNLRLSALGMTPYGKSQTTTSPTTASNPWLSGLGGASTGASIANALSLSGSSALGMTGLGGLLGLLSSSDREDKTDIKKLGEDPQTGLPMYAYRYKGDPKTYPKTVGPMAQDIEKKFPGAVGKVGGHRVVARNFGFGAPMMARG